MTINLNPIGVVHSCFKEKFGTPRQPGLIEYAYGEIEIFAEYAQPEAFAGLEAFSHLWVVFHFHQTAAQGWKPSVRPPRLGGNKKMGVFATRSMFRPNPLGLSVVKFEGISVNKDSVRIAISGQDLIEGTPVMDIKPYIPYVDRIENATAGYADQSPQLRLKINWTKQASEVVEDLPLSFKNLIEKSIAYDPRPQYHQDAAADRIYGLLLDHYNVKWKVDNGQAEIIAVEMVD